MATKRAQPNWQIHRGYLGPAGRVFFRRAFTIKARTRDQAIERAAHKIKGIALLKATRVAPARAFFVAIKLVKE
jgi:hypothetical protein